MIEKLELKKTINFDNKVLINNVFDDIDSDIAEIVKKINEIIDKLNELPKEK